MLGMLTAVAKLYGTMEKYFAVVNQPDPEQSQEGQHPEAKDEAENLGMDDAEDDCLDDAEVAELLARPVGAPKDEAVEKTDGEDMRTELTKDLELMRLDSGPTDKQVEPASKLEPQTSKKVIIIGDGSPCLGSSGPPGKRRIQEPDPRKDRVEYLKTCVTFSLIDLACSLIVVWYCAKMRMWAVSCAAQAGDCQETADVVLHGLGRKTGAVVMPDTDTLPCPELSPIAKNLASKFNAVEGSAGKGWQDLSACPAVVPAEREPKEELTAAPDMEENSKNEDETKAPVAMENSDEDIFHAKAEISRAAQFQAKEDLLPEQADEDEDEDCDEPVVWKKPTAKAKAKAKASAKAKAKASKAKAKAQEESELAEPGFEVLEAAEVAESEAKLVSEDEGQSKSEDEVDHPEAGVKATFARRYRPGTDASASHRWLCIKDVFQLNIGPLLTCTSKAEAWTSCSGESLMLGFCQHTRIDNHGEQVMVWNHCMEAIRERKKGDSGRWTTARLPEPVLTLSWSSKQYKDFFKMLAELMKAVADEISLHRYVLCFVPFI